MSEDDDIILVTHGVNENLNATIGHLHEPNGLSFQHAAVAVIQESATHGDFAGRIATNIVETPADLLANHQRGRAVRPQDG